MTVEQLTNKIEAAIVEVVNSKNINVSTKKVFSIWDDRIRNKWNGLKIPPVVGKNCDKSNMLH